MNTYLSKVRIRNRVRRVRTDFSLYEAGYLGVREQRAGYFEPEHRFALRHLDPRPALSSRVAETARGAALSSIALASFMAGLAYLSVAPAITVSAGVAALIARPHSG